MSVYLFCVQVSSPLTCEQAAYARDALAKGVYNRLFMWIVKHINSSLSISNVGKSIADRATVLGLLDIYGFEVFETNGYQCSLLVVV